jgi:hypothetical protein
MQAHQHNSVQPSEAEAPRAPKLLPLAPAAWPTWQGGGQQQGYTHCSPSAQQAVLLAAGFSTCLPVVEFHIGFAGAALTGPVEGLGFNGVAAAAEH